MALTTSEKVFDEEEIRDTNTHNGTTIYLGEFRLKTIIIENELNQQVTLQCQGSAHSDFSNNFNIGNSWNVAASTDTYETCDSYFPYMRLTATCATAPTSGSLTVHFVEYGA